MSARRTSKAFNMRFFFMLLVFLTIASNAQAEHRMYCPQDVRMESPSVLSKWFYHHYGRLNGVRIKHKSPQLIDTMECIAESGRVWAIIQRECQIEALGGELTVTGDAKENEQYCHLNASSSSPTNDKQCVVVCGRKEPLFPKKPN
jgi:hypothetical protein